MSKPHSGPGQLEPQPTAIEHCEECTIQIGNGYEESIPFEFVDDEQPNRQRVLRVCWRCWESLNRRRLKRQSGAAEASPAH